MRTHAHTHTHTAGWPRRTPASASTCRRWRGSRRDPRCPPQRPAPPEVTQGFLQEVIQGLLRQIDIPRILSIDDSNGGGLSSEKGEVLLRGVGTLRYFFQRKAKFPNLLRTLATHVGHKAGSST